MNPVTDHLSDPQLRPEILQIFAKTKKKEAPYFYLQGTLRRWPNKVSVCVCCVCLKLPFPGNEDKMPVVLI